MDALEQGADAATDVFQIIQEVGIDPVTMEPILESVDGKWYFNARSQKKLTGTWIGPAPDSPAQVWA